MKQFRALAAALVTAALLAAGAYADFSRNVTYTPGRFADVPETEWYAESVKDAYEFGIMNGTSDTTFEPEGTLTTAEGVTIAARIHATLANAAIPASDGEWYEQYVSYAKANGFLAPEGFDNYDRNITRSEIATLLADVCGDLAVINEVNAIPDVPASAPYAAKVLKLYKAGILTGNDGFGTFAPDSDLKRSEISAMAVRIADSTKRVKKAFAAAGRTFTDGYAIVDARDINSRTGLANGWNLDDRYQLANLDGLRSKVIVDTDDEQHKALIRRFAPETEGLLTAIVTGTVYADDNAFYFAFENEKEEKIVSLTGRDGHLVLIGKDGETVVTENEYGASHRYYVQFYLDLDNDTVFVKVDNKVSGKVSIASDAVIDRFVAGTEKSGKAALTLHYMKVFKNYPVFEPFFQNTTQVGEMPALWESDGFTVEYAKSSAGYDLDSAKAVGKASARLPFEPVSGKFGFETYILLPEKADGAAVSLQSAGKDVLRFETANGYFTINGVQLHDYMANVWYRLSFDADTSTGTAEVRVNGKKKAEVPFAAAFFDAVSVTFDPADNSKVMWFDDVALYSLVDHDDYPAPPVRSNDDNYNIGMNVCYLWRDNDAMEGWDSVSFLPEFDSPLGYYDEGARECADWELKIMAEHGIDFMHICWYEPYNNIDTPLKKMARSFEALHDGYFNAKYSDAVKFCLMWENGGCGIKDLEQFKQFIWPFWKEYYFSDERYARLDNKAVLSVWDTARLISDFGDEDGVKRWKDFLESELKKMGYDGLVLIVTHDAGGSTSRARYNQLDRMGVDATYTYNSGKSGYTASFMINGMKSLKQNSDGVGYAIPSVSIGFNNIGRWDERVPIISAEEHLEVCQFIKDTLAASHTGSWKDNTLFVSTWNEYSEGTYVYPTAGTGWHYLDNIRKTFTNDTAASRAFTLTDAQKARINRMYPPHFALLRRFKYEEEESALDPANGTAVDRYDFAAKEDEGKLKASDVTVADKYDFAAGKDTGAFIAGHNVENVAITGGKLMGSSIAADHSLMGAAIRPFNAADAPFIHVRMKATASSGLLRVFFITDSDSTWNNAKRVTAPLGKAGEYVDYYLNLSALETYKGRVTNLRIDPINGNIGNFEITLIELLKFNSEEAMKAATSKTQTLFVVNHNVKDFAIENGSMHGVTTSGDHGLMGAAVRPYKAENAPIIHVRMKTSEAAGLLRIFFITDDDKTWNNAKRITVPLKGAGEYYDYYVDMSALDTYSGTIANLRIDPMNGAIGSFEISLIEMLGFTDEQLAEIPSVEVNGIKLAQSFNIKEEANGDYVVGMEQRLGFFSMMRLFYDWDRFTDDGVLTLKSYTDHTLVLHIGKSTAEYDGKVIDLGFTPYMRDGVVMVNINKLCELFGYKYTKDRKTLKLQICSDEDYAKIVAINTAVNNWQFNLDGEMEKWTLQNTGAYVAGGVLHMDPTNNDPALYHEVDFRANDYNTMTVRIKDNPTMHAEGVEAPLAFFITSTDGTWTASKKIIGEYDFENIDEEGFVQVHFYMPANALYTGKITGIRFDPYNRDTPCDVDYIVMENRERRYTTAEKAALEQQKEAIKKLFNDDGYTLDKSVSVEFDSEADVKRFTTMSCNLSYEDGFLLGTPTKGDCALYVNMDFDCSEYRRMVVGFKYNAAMTNSVPNGISEFYFITTTDEAWNKQKLVQSVYVLPDDVKEGDVVRAVFDLTSCANFTGTMKTLRIDPYNNDKPFAVDYIRLYK